MKLRIVGPYIDSVKKSGNRVTCKCHDCDGERRTITGVFIASEDLPMGGDDSDTMRATVHFNCSHQSLSLFKDN